jgi:hypothetical protein
MQRTIVPEARYFSKEIAPGVFHQKFHPGGIDGPNDEVLLPTPGGQSWSEIIAVGEPGDEFHMVLPDIRMPPNQYWPLHWHDCWTVVLIVEGQCCIGDWWMEPGDVFVTVPSLEYGPLMVGPKGCRLFEIFAKAHLSPGGYAPEYRDHPTLQGGQRPFKERSALNRRNEGRQTMPLDGVEGIWKSRLECGRVWELGDPGDPDRGIMKYTCLGGGESIAADRCDDWHAVVVMDGSIEIGGRTLGRDELLLVHPGSTVGEITAGAGGAGLLELARRAGGAAARLLG